MTQCSAALRNAGGGWERRRNGWVQSQRMAEIAAISLARDPSVGQSVTYNSKRLTLQRTMPSLSERPLLTRTKRWWKAEVGRRLNVSFSKHATWSHA